MLAAGVLSGCATFSDDDVVASFGDVDIAGGDFEPLADEYFENGEVFGTSPQVSGHADGEQARFLIRALVQQAALREFLAANDVDADDLRQNFTDSIPADSPLDALSAEFQDLIYDVDPQLRGEALARVESPSPEVLRALYADNPAGTGMLCMRHILVATEAEADDVLAELAAGADFATLAAERSTDPSAAAGGGALNNGDNQCIPLQTITQGFDPGFTAGALAAHEGVPSPPVESGFGWHIILHRPWEEIADSVLALHQTGDSGGYLFDGYLATTEVRVDPRYGVWDPIAGTVVPLG